MCGIAGWIDYHADLHDQKPVLTAMCDTLVRRGPDAKGYHVEPHAALAHRRLIVIDPEGGRQPMSRRLPSTTYTLVYNGELYNTQELRSQLTALGHSFQGHSDTEVLLESYIQWGAGCLDRLNGIYAFAIWDSQRQKLFLARDRMGVKPLFFYQYQEGLLFGSEIKTLLAHPRVRPQVDENGLKELFLLGPGVTPGCGVFKGVEELLPGQCATFDSSGLHTRTYWKLQPAPHPDDRETTIQKTRELVTDAITRQLVSDVPLGCFLSGGLDSSLISALAARHYARLGMGKLDTFSVDYPDNDRYFTQNAFQPDSDNPYIAQMATAIGSNHHHCVLDNDALADGLLPAVAARDLPGMADIDSSLLLFCREVKKHCTVALSGECADEVFGGYPWYHHPSGEQGFPWSHSAALRESLLKPGLLSRGRDYVHSRYQATVALADLLPGESPEDSRIRQMTILNLYWFMQTLLTRKDRMSMYWGLEVRVPFCDHRLVEYLYNMPWHLKALEGREKGILRAAMEGVLPQEVLWRKKSPYPKTAHPHYWQLMCQRTHAMLADPSSPLTPLLNEEAVERLIQQPDSLSSPWYGQLMRAPQILAWLLQTDHWMRTYHVELI